MATRTRRGARAEAPATTAETASVQEDTVTDIQTPEIQDNAGDQTTEPEAGTVEAGHTFNVGDAARVVRGKLRGQNGKILAYSKTDKTYAITLESGTLATVNAGNLKAPEDSTVSVRAIVSALASYEDTEAATRLAAALDATVPGVSEKLNEARGEAASA